MLHATLVARWTGGAWRGVLVEAPSGAGKSALALTLTQQDWRLVADDRVRVWASGGRLFGRAPDPLYGLLEVRGVGVLPVGALPFAEVALVLAHADDPERIPEAATRTIAGVSVPAVALNLRDPTTPSRLRRRLDSDAASHGFALQYDGRITPASPAGPRVPSKTP